MAKIREKLEEYISIQYHNLDSIIKHLTTIRDKYKEKYESMEFDEDYTGCYYSGDKPDMVLMGIREETEEEAQSRIDKEAAQKAAQTKREKELYKTLKQKYGKS